MNTLLITGANRGLGLEFVRQYLAESWRVHACCRNLLFAEELQQLAKDYSDHLVLHELDMNDLSAIESLADELRDQPVDLLLSNAGVYGGNNQALENIRYSDWHETLLINALAPLKLANCFAEHVAASQLKKMVFMSSKMGSMLDNGSGGVYIYRASKAALNAIVKSLSYDLRPAGISVVCLHPGWVRTDMGGPHGLIDPPESIAAMRQVISDLGLATSGRFMDYLGHEIPW